jgi:hypothetical protein
MSYMKLYIQCIVLILIMRVTQLRQADLNLLVVFSVLAEERNVSHAAKRLSLSRPAVSRALQRMRDTFHDDLLVRTAKGYETNAARGTCSSRARDHVAEIGSAHLGFDLRPGDGTLFLPVCGNRQCDRDHPSRSLPRSLQVGEEMSSRT